MFDANLLTPEVKTYLSIESDWVVRMFTTHSNYKHLIEIGCGYGRFLPWIVTNGLKYTGIDSVSWMIELAQLRYRSIDPNSLTGSAKLIHATAENIETVIQQKDVEESSSQTLELFPFNCLGNILEQGQAIRGAANLKLDIMVSSFSPTEDSTLARMKYYSNCGYSHLNIQNSLNGIVITSEEGLRSLAANKDYYCHLFSKFGYHLVWEKNINNIADLYLFSLNKNRIAPVETRDKTDRRKTPRIELQVAVEIAILSETASVADYSRILPIESLKAIAVDVSEAGVLVNSESEVAMGTVARVLFSTPKGSLTLNGRVTMTRENSNRTFSFLVAPAIKDKNIVESVARLKKS